MEVSALLMVPAIVVVMAIIVVVVISVVVVRPAAAAFSARGNALHNRLVLVLHRRVQRRRRRARDGSGSGTAAARLLKDAVKRKTGLQRDLRGLRRNMWDVSNHGGRCVCQRMDSHGEGNIDKSRKLK